MDGFCGFLLVERWPLSSEDLHSVPLAISDVPYQQAGSVSRAFLSKVSPRDFNQELASGEWQGQDYNSASWGEDSVHIRGLLNPGRH